MVPKQSNKAGHREADIYEDVSQGGRVTRVKKEAEAEKPSTSTKKGNTSEL